MPPRTPPKGKSPISRVSSLSPPCTAAEDAAVSSPAGRVLSVHVVFQGEKSDSTSLARESAPVDKVLLSAQDFKSLRFKAGELVAIDITGCAACDVSMLYLRAWPGPSIQKGLIALNSLWKSSFVPDSSARGVRVVHTPEALLVRQARAVVFAVESSIARYSSSEEFYNFLRVYISSVFLTPGISLSLPWKSSKAVLLVIYPLCLGLY